VADTPRTTRDVTPADVAEVVVDPRRATVTFVDDGEPAIVPVRARRAADRWRFTAAALALDGREVVLLLDDGDWWFELRGVSVRGVARRRGEGAVGCSAPLRRREARINETQLRNAPLGDAMQALSTSGCVFEQQLGLLGSIAGVPPFPEQAAALLLNLHFGPMVDVKQQVTAPVMPQAERAAHFFTAPLQFFGRVGFVPLDSDLATPATQLTYWP
jgi:hypothetical protein